MRFSCSTQNEPNEGVAASSCLNGERVECNMKMFLFFHHLKKKKKTGGKKRELKCNPLHLLEGRWVELVLPFLSESGLSESLLSIGRILTHDSCSSQPSEF